MGIADIFEALNAEGPAVQAGQDAFGLLAILGRMKEGGHIDPDLFDTFVRRKVYLKYANEFLDTGQIDEIDLAEIPGFVP